MNCKYSSLLDSQKDDRMKLQPVASESLFGSPVAIPGTNDGYSINNLSPFLPASSKK